MTPLENLFHTGFLHASSWPCPQIFNRSRLTTTLDDDQFEQLSPLRRRNCHRL
ncbi:hypothetical protein Hanom_Chr00s000002g01598941 [Helianthus anomalus]